jgi:hypothetical protein
MASDEVAAVLRESGYDAEDWPIARHVEALRTARHVPDFDLGMCTARYEEAGPALRAVLAAAADAPSLSEEDATLLFRGLFIIGAARDTGAFQPLLRLLRHPERDLDYLLGDLVTESLAQIVASTFDGDVPALLTVIVDPARDEFVRDALLGAATFLAWDRRIDREQMRLFLEYFYQERLAEDKDYAWIGWLHAIALLGLRDLEPLVRKAWDDGRIPEKILDYEDFESDLAAAERDPDDVGRFHAANLGYVDDVLNELAWVRSIERHEESHEDDAVLDFIEPVTNPLRHVGRNDPCPCGSGKKAKKCCLGTAAENPAMSQG